MVDIGGETIGLFPFSLPFFFNGEALYRAIQTSFVLFKYLGMAPSLTNRK